MALVFEFSLNQRDRSLLETLSASLRAVAQMAPTMEAIMAGMDNLNTNLDKFAADFATFSTDFAAAVKALQDAVGGGNEAAIQSAADRVAALDTQVTTLDDTAKGLMNPPPPPPPLSSSRPMGGGGGGGPQIG